MLWTCLSVIVAHPRSLTISWLGHAHKIKNLTDNTKSFIVCKMLEGLRRKSPPKIGCPHTDIISFVKPFNTFTFASLQFSV